MSTGLTRRKLVHMPCHLIFGVKVGVESLQQSASRLTITKSTGYHESVNLHFSSLSILAAWLPCSVVASRTLDCITQRHICYELAWMSTLHLGCARRAVFTSSFSFCLGFRFRAAILCFHLRVQISWLAWLSFGFCFYARRLGWIHVSRLRDK